MKLSNYSGCVLLSVIELWLILVGVGAHEDPSADDSARHQGSWSHWWSYDGISGPDYWNINKQWRSCSAGRKQSPIDIRTDRLVYDHLLAPIHLAWRPDSDAATPAIASKSLGANEHYEEEEEEQQQQEKSLLPEVAEALAESSSTTTKTTTTTSANTVGLDNNSVSERSGPTAASSSGATSGHQQQPIRVQLLNSGRGIEAWLEGREGGLSHAHGGAPDETPPPDDHHRQQQQQLIISRGPLSYAYKLFKIELHSSSNYAANKHDDQEDNLNDDNENNTRPPSSSGSGQLRSLPEASKWSSSASLAAAAVGKSSEHLIDGKSFDAEVQLHFYNKHLALSAREALNLINASPSSAAPASLFTIISVFISLRRNQTTTTMTTASQEDNLDKTRTSTTRGYQQMDVGGLQPLDFILDNLRAIQNQGNSIELRLARHHIDSLITTKTDYITYQGSLNRPPCAESVDWILLNKALRVDVGKFAQLYEKLNTNQENIRPISPLNGRQLRTSINLGARNHFYQQQQHKTSDGDCEKQSNCTNGIGLQPRLQSSESFRQNDGLHRHKQVASKWRQCSMKPNYVYQFSYGKSLANNK